MAKGTEKGLRAVFAVEDVGWRWRPWVAPGDWRLCCPEHAGTPAC